MANGKRIHAEKATDISGSPKTSRVFYRMKDRAKRALEHTKTFGKFILKYPKTALAATAITVMLLTPVKTSAQDVSGKTELVSDKELSDKYRETKLKDGFITFEGVGTFDVRDAMKLINGTENVSEGAEKKKIEEITLEGIGKGTYYIFETGIAGFFVNKGEKTIQVRAAEIDVGDRLFLNAIFLADNGAIFATSTKRFIGLTSTGSYAYNYPDILKLKEPVFSAGTDNDKIDLRDPLTLGKEGMKMQFSFSTIKIEFLDDAPLGGAND